MCMRVSVYVDIVYCREYMYVVFDNYDTIQHNIHNTGILMYALTYRDGHSTGRTRYKQVYYRHRYTRRIALQGLVIRV